MRELERELSTDAAPAAEGLSIPPIAVIGLGRVGRSLAAAAEWVGITTRLAGRDAIVDACRRSEVAVLCVPDTEISAACEVVAREVPPLRFVGHTSGATTLGALGPARERGAEVFSLHPLQMIPDPDTDLAGAPSAVAGSTDSAVALARSLSVRVGMRPFEVPEEHRAAYRTAAAMSSNLLVALEESAADLLERAGVDSPSRELLAPLVVRTVANWAARGPEALTGPITRGDSETIDRHLEALQEVAPELIPVYESPTDRARAASGLAEAVR